MLIEKRSYRNEERKRLGFKLYDIQPKECRQMLPLPPHIDTLHEKVRRIFRFDPTPIYDVINAMDLIHPYSRTTSVSLSYLFPSRGKYCSCGCGVELKGRQKRWATEACSDFAFSVFCIIRGDMASIRNLLRLYHGGIYCIVNKEHTDNIETDHIYPVKFGGGGGWLSNYEFKCIKCHREKTNKDFGFKQQQELEEDKSQLKLL